ncbi:hypothetical protein [uncultured Porphyromonas sp.]|uniref:hypothetical protein n=1 Tax=uncultured Porphyromonas sp. TaxID=159274 RepID=UPI0025F00BF9|nr:hypothetical protein [uncultured Porphyromonas sp.]
MNRPRYNIIYTTLLTIGMLLSLASCVRQDCDEELIGDGQGLYFSLQFGVRGAHSQNLRAQEDGVYSINTDKTDKDDYVKELRIILLQGDEVKKNFAFKAIDPDSHGLYKLTMGDNELSFRLTEEELGIYDMIVIANESFGRITRRETLSSVLPDVKTRDEIMAIRLMSSIERTVSSRFYIPMTAEYRGVDMRKGGSKDSPLKLQLPTPTNGVELLRIFAKVELIIKDCVEVTRRSDGKYDCSWIGPWGFDRVVTIDLDKVSDETPLFPANQYSSLETSSDATAVTLSRVVDVSSVVGLDDLPKDDPIGGVYLLDYRAHFYLPERLVAQGQEAEQATVMKIKWNYYPDPWDSSKKEKHTSLVSFARQNKGADDYLTTSATFDPSDKSVYRNSCYRVTINPYRADFRSLDTRLDTL